MFGVPVFAFTPVDGGKVDELVEDVFLILVDIKNVMLIGTGQITEGLNHVTQEFMALHCWQRFVFCICCQGP